MAPEQFAYLLTQLDAVPEGEGTLLDHTMVLWVSELGLTRTDQENPHLRSDVPMIIAGGSAGTGMTMGRYADFSESDAHYHDLLLTLSRGLGLDHSAYGDQGTRVLEDLLA